VIDPKNPKQIKDAARKFVRPLVWSDGEFDGNPTGEWYAYGVSEHVIYKDGKLFAYWSEGEGPKYDTLIEAQEAANENHVSEVMRLFNWMNDD